MVKSLEIDPNSQNKIDDFNELIDKSNHTLLIAVHMPRCGWCGKLLEEWEHLKNGDIKMNDDITLAWVHMEARSSLKTCICRYSLGVLFFDVFCSEFCFFWESDLGSLLECFPSSILVLFVLSCFGVLVFPCFCAPVPLYPDRARTVPLCPGRACGACARVPVVPLCRFDAQGVLLDPDGGQHRSTTAYPTLPYPTMLANGGELTIAGPAIPPAH